MRQIVLDTETTGLEPKLGHRIVEIAAVELWNRRLTGNRFHFYLNPERDIDEKAQEVHGLSREFLSDKPKFKDIAAQFLDYVNGAQLVIHNAPFDLSFLDAELGRLDLTLRRDPVPIDTLAMAKELHPGKRNNLDALCERYQINNSKRVLHGALLDAELLAEVYLAMTRGQDSLIIDLDQDPAVSHADAEPEVAVKIHVLKATSDELALHEEQLAQIDKASKGACLWKMA